jgi:hypothetical protein
MATYPDNAAPSAVANGICGSTAADPVTDIIDVSNVRSPRALILNPARLTRNAAYAKYAEEHPPATIPELFVGWREAEADIAANDNVSPSDHAFAGMLAFRSRMLAGLMTQPARDLADAIIKATVVRDIVGADRHAEPEVRLLLDAILTDLDHLLEAS